MTIGRLGPMCLAVFGAASTATPALAEAIAAAPVGPAESLNFREYSATGWAADTDADLDAYGGQFVYEHSQPSGNQRSDYAYSTDPETFLNTEIAHPALNRWRVNSDTYDIYGSASHYRSGDVDTAPLFEAYQGESATIGVSGGAWATDNVNFSGFVQLTYNRFEYSGDPKVHDEYPIRYGVTAAYRSPKILLGRLSDRVVEQVSASGATEVSFEGRGYSSGLWLGVDYAGIAQIHRDPWILPQLVEFNAGITRETTIWQNQWLEAGVSLHGTLGTQNEASKPRGMHYSLGFEWTSFDKDDNEQRDLSIDSTGRAYGTGFAEVEIARFRSRSIRVRLSQYTRQYEQAPDVDYWIVGLSVRSNR